VDTEKIETFLCAADNLSFSEAAKLLHLSQPSVSHQIKTLEQELGVDLFKRSSTGLELTEGGRVLLPWARRLIHDSVNLKEIMTSLEEEIVGPDAADDVDRLLGAGQKEAGHVVGVNGLDEQPDARGVESGGGVSKVPDHRLMGDGRIQGRRFDAR